MRCVRALLHDRVGLACLLFLGIVLLAALLAGMLCGAATGLVCLANRLMQAG